MNILSLSIAQLKSKPFNSVLSICMFALGIGIISLLLHFERYTENQIQGNIGEIDLVVGAKGSPLQLIMSSVLHVDNPTGNISLKEADEIGKNPMVRATIPVSLGDNYKGYRIVGTTDSYVKLYQAQLDAGEWNKKGMEVLIGNEVAKTTELQVGDQFTGVHGFMTDGHHHDEDKYLVTGILKPTGKVIDRLLITNVESVWEVHNHEDEEEHHDHEEHEHDHAEHNHDHEGHKHDHDEKHEDHEGHQHEKKDHAEKHHKHDEDEEHHDHEKSKLEKIQHKIENQEALTEEEMEFFNKQKKHMDGDDDGKEITALLVFYRNPMAAATLARTINETTNLQAASPLFQLNRLLSLLGYGFKALNVLAWIIIVFSGINILIHLLNKLNQEIYDIALLRSLGVGRFKVLLMLIGQSLLLTVVGWIVGLILVRVVIFLIAFFAEGAALTLQYSVLSQEIVMLAYALLVGLLSALLPAIKAYRTDIHFLLNKL